MGVLQVEDNKIDRQYGDATIGNHLRSIEHGGSRASGADSLIVCNALHHFI